MRLNDSVTNISQGILIEIFKIPVRGAELLLYTWIYNNWRLHALPWDSPWTWLTCMVTTDFLFYWMHRATHQCSILWQFHEPHHSSEDFNLTTPLRLSIFTSCTMWLTYLPMAFFIPPSVFLVHYQLNVIFQYWLHSEYIPRLGVLEYVFVTPSHHRVHHGRNRWCIDKNFGSIFILWDRLFGTFEPERNTKIVYGVTTPLRTFSPIQIQTGVLQNIWHRFKTVEGLSNKLSVIFKGPGWKPGTSWLGRLEDVPEPREDEPKYDPQLPMWLEIYVSFHTGALVIGYLQLILNLSMVSAWTLTLSSLFIILTTISIGCLLDLSSSAPILEIIRCPLYFILDTIIQREFQRSFTILYLSMYGFRSLFLASFVFWILACPFTKKLQISNVMQKKLAIN
uniref:Alkylglycerol monooxygenase n=1 Tax=Parasteatoda tepidariorum TaxID=114398 RepID=A0A2L2YEN4_PARTP